MKDHRVLSGMRPTGQLHLGQKKLKKNFPNL